MIIDILRSKMPTESFGLLVMTKFFTNQKMAFFYLIKVLHSLLHHLLHHLPDHLLDHIPCGVISGTPHITTLTTPLNTTRLPYLNYMKVLVREARNYRNKIIIKAMRLLCEWPIHWTTIQDYTRSFVRMIKENLELNAMLSSETNYNSHAYENYRYVIHDVIIT